MIKLLIGGSPCTNWSIAKKEGRETEPSGIGWELFRNYVIAKEKFKPDIFLYENVASASPLIKEAISEALGVDLIQINSALVSAQNRNRIYGVNAKVEQPADRGILLRDILESGVSCRNEKAYCLDANYYKGGDLTSWNKQRGQRLMVAESVRISTIGNVAKNHKHNSGQLGKIEVIESADGNTKPVYEVREGQILINSVLYPINLRDGYYMIRKLTVTECCRLQTLPDDYCRAVSSTQGYKGLGNGWTAEVIIHILRTALKDVPRTECIQVLSMYDGIGTGMYCMKVLGFKNIKYHAYEIDKYAMTVANSNHPEIIQHGDAFAVRNAEVSVGD